MSTQQRGATVTGSTVPIIEGQGMTEQNSNAQYNKMTPSQVAALVADAQGWKPEDGDELQGTVLAVKQGYSDMQQRNYPIVFIMNDNGSCTAVHCFQTVLYNEIVSQRPKPGEVIYIKQIGATGEAKRAGQSPTIKYAVMVQREGANDPWEHMDLQQQTQKQ